MSNAFIMPFSSDILYYQAYSMRPSIYNNIYSRDIKRKKGLRGSIHSSKRFITPFVQSRLNGLNAHLMRECKLYIALHSKFKVIKFFLEMFCWIFARYFSLNSEMPDFG